MKKFSKNIISGGSFFVFSLLVADGLNFVFSAYLARVLSFSDLGLITLFGTLWNFIAIFVGALATTVTHRTAYLSAKVNKEEGIGFYKATIIKSFFIASLCAVLWLIATPFLSEFFDIDRLTPLLLFTPLIVLGVMTAANRGFLQGNFSFFTLGIFSIIEGITKLSAVLFLTFIHLNNIAYFAIIFSEVTDFALTMWFVATRTSSVKIAHKYEFPFKFFGASLVARLSTTAFLILDVILAKHFLSPNLAGQYALLSFAGKMVFYFGSLLNAFVVSFVSRDQGLNKNPYTTYVKIFGGTIVLTTLVYVCIGPMGYLTVPFLFGTKAYAIVPYLALYGLSIGLFTLANQIVTYHLARHHYVFPITAISYACAIIAAITLFHANIGQIVGAVFFISLLNFTTLMILHLFDVRGEYVFRNIVDLIEVLLPISSVPSESITGKRILIFNWRDTKHVYSGGAEVYIHEIAKRWVAKGNKVTLFCGNDGKSVRHEVIDSVEIVRRGGIYFVYIWAFVYYSLRFRGKYDVIIDAQNGIPFFTPMYAKEKVYCLMFHVHQEFFRRSLIHPLYMLAYFLEQKAMPLVYRNVPFLTISESTKRDMKKLGLGRAGIEIIYPGVNLDNLGPAKKSKHPMILYLGRLKDYKSVHILVQAAPKILKKFPRAEIVIAGFGEEEKNLKKLAKKLNIADKVSFLGKVTEEQKIKLYQTAWVFVNPSFLEGWGITTIEANACGTTVVASDVPGLQDSVVNPHTGFLVPYGSARAFAEKIMLLLSDRNMLKAMSNEALEWSSRFDWNKSAEKGLKILERV